MLNFKRDALLMSLRPPQAFRPIPPASDRRAWEGIGAELGQLMFKRAEAALSHPIPMITASMIRAGQPHLEAYATRRSLLSALALGACAKGPDRYLPAILDLIWAMLEETSWSLPALPGELKSDARIDLNAAQTAGLLALCLYLLASELSKLAPHIGVRIHQALLDRAILPLIGDAKDALRLRAGEVPCAADALLSAVLLIEDNSQRRWFATRTLVSMLETHFQGGLRDGGCRFGLERHMRDAFALSNCLFMLSLVSGGEVELRDEPEFVEMAMLPVRLHIGGGWFLNPGGLTPMPFIDPDQLFRLGDNARSTELCALASYLYKQYGVQPLNTDAPLMHQLLNALYHQDLIREPASPVLLPSVALPDMQLMSARVGGYYMALIGGETRLPGHLDVGDLCLFYRGQPVLIDPGAAIESLHHSVPAVEGFEQSYTGRKPQNGPDFKFDPNLTLLSLGIAHAYPPEAGLLSWQRSLMLSAHEDILRLMDVVDLEHGALKTLSFRFLTPQKPELLPGAIRIGELTLYPEAEFSALIEPVPLLSPALRSLWGGSFYRLTLTTHQPVPGGTFAFELRPSDDSERG